MGTVPDLYGLPADNYGQAAQHILNELYEIVNTAPEGRRLPGICFPSSPLLVAACWWC